MFKLEPIVDSNFKRIGHEVLTFLPLIPNSLLFSVPNKKLEIYLFEKYIRRESIRLSGTNGNFFSFNFSFTTFKEYFDLIMELCKKFPRLLIEITEIAPLDEEWFLRNKDIHDFWHERVILDDCLESFLTLRDIDRVPPPKGFKISVRTFENLRKRGMDIGTFLNKYQGDGRLLIAEKIETAEELEKAKELGFNAFQGYLIKDMVIYGDHCATNRHASLILYLDGDTYPGISTLLEIRELLKNHDDSSSLKSFRKSRKISCKTRELR